VPVALISDQCTGRPDTCGRLHGELGADRPDGVDPDRPPDTEVELVLVLGEVLRHDLLGGARRVVGGERHAGQVRDAVGTVDPQRRPAVPPRATRAVFTVEDDEPRPGLQPGAAQAVGGRQPGLPGPDHDDIRAHAWTTPERGCSFRTPT